MSFDTIISALAPSSNELDGSLEPRCSRPACQMLSNYLTIYLLLLSCDEFVLLVSINLEASETVPGLVFEMSSSIELNVCGSWWITNSHQNVLCRGDGRVSVNLYYEIDFFLLIKVKILEKNSMFWIYIFILLLERRISFVFYFLFYILPFCWFFLFFLFFLFFRTVLIVVSWILSFDFRISFFCAILLLNLCLFFRLRF